MAPLLFLPKSAFASWSDFNLTLCGMNVKLRHYFYCPLTKINILN